MVTLIVQAHYCGSVVSPYVFTRTFRPDTRNGRAVRPTDKRLPVLEPSDATSSSSCNAPGFPFDTNSGTRCRIWRRYATRTVRATIVRFTDEPERYVVLGQSGQLATRFLASLANVLTFLRIFNERATFIVNIHRIVGLAERRKPYRSCYLPDHTLDPEVAVNFLAAVYLLPSPLLWVLHSRSDECLCIRGMYSIRFD